MSAREPTEIITKDVQSPWYATKFRELDSESVHASQQYTLHMRRMQRLQRVEGGFVTARTLRQIEICRDNLRYWHWKLVSIGSRRKFLAAAYKRWQTKAAAYRPPPPLPRSDTILLDDDGNVLYDRYDAAFETEEEEGFEPLKHGEY